METNRQNSQYVVPGYGTVPRDHMMSLLSHFDVVHQEFAAKFPFESFVPNQDCTLETILNGLNNQIVQIIHSISNGSIGFDVAFLQINALMVYAASVITHENRTEAVDYYQFLLYFIIYGCCLGTKYATPSFTCRTINDIDIFPYFTRQYMNDWPLRLKYTYCGSLRESIVYHISSCLSNQYGYYGAPIAMMIADYTLFEFEEFLYVTSYWTLQPNNKEKCGVARLHATLGLQAESYATLIPKLLLHFPEFNSEIQSNLHFKYFANQLLFQSIYWNEPPKHYTLIRNLFASGSITTRHPWFLIECVGGYEDVYGEAATLQVLQQCLDTELDTESRSLNVFCDEAILNIKHVDILFNEFVVRYGTKNNTILVFLLK
eukprot:350302_1